MKIYKFNSFVYIIFIIFFFQYSALADMQEVDELRNALESEGVEFDKLVALRKVKNKKGQTYYYSKVRNFEYPKPYISSGSYVVTNKGEIKGLYLGFKKMKDFSFLRSLKHIRFFYCKKCEVDSIKGLSHITTIESIDLYMLKVRGKIEQIHSLPKLKSLEITYGKIRAIEISTLFPELEFLKINGAKLKKIPPLEYFPKLVNLDLADNDITELVDFRKINTLETLELSGNDISDLKGFQYFKNIKKLKLVKNKIKKIEVDEESAMEELHIDYNPLEDISGLKKLVHLKILGLSGVEDIPIPDLSSVERLYLVQSEIKNLKAFKGLTGLKNLAVNDSRIKSLDGVENFKQLERINASYTYLTNMKPLSNLTKLKEIKFLNSNMQSDYLMEVVNGNPDIKVIQLSSTPINYNNSAEILKEIESRGIDVFVSRFKLDQYGPE